MRTTKYRCTNCDAEDSDHQMYTDAPLALVCWKCREGKQARTPMEQAAARLGMLPATDATE